MTTEKTKRDRKQTTINAIVGRRDGAFYAVNYTFDDILNGSTFRGVTGTLLVPVSARRVEEAKELDNLKDRFEDCWREAVKAGSTEQGLEEWVEPLADELENLFDLSDYDLGCKAAEIYNSELDPAATDDDDRADFSECIGGGRCFKASDADPKNWDKVYRPDLLPLFAEFED